MNTFVSSMLDTVVRYIMDCSKMKQTPSDVLIKQSMFK